MNTAKSKNRLAFARTYGKISNKITRATGTPAALFIAFSIILVWGVTGPLFAFSDTWQLAINTSTTIITFLMVFIIQQSQNKDTIAIQLKLNELIASNDKSSNRLIDIEDLTDQELTAIKKFYVKLSKLAEKDSDISAYHSLSEADDWHQRKIKKRKASTAVLNTDGTRQAKV